MQVNVFIARDSGQLQNKLLVLPPDPKAPIPKEYRLGWRYFATTGTEDAMFGDINAVAIEKEIEASGYAVVEPVVRDRI